MEPVHKQAFRVETDRQVALHTHKRLKTAANSIDFYLPYLFKFEECGGMPNTNNKIEGLFTDLKKNLNNHSGMSEGNRKRFIIGFFKA